MKKELLKLIIETLDTERSISFSTWHNERLSTHFDAVKKQYKESPNIEINGEQYIIHHSPQRNTIGGMDDGSPETYTIKKLTVPAVFKFDTDTPEVQENINWDGVIGLAKKIVKEIEDGEYHEDNDYQHYMWEGVMTAIYGRDFFKWYNKNI